MNEPLTVIFFSCRRLQMLIETVQAFIHFNKYPLYEFIIVNDSADPAIHKQLEETYENVTFVFNKNNVGLMRSIDIGYKYIDTEYFFHAEDDWKLTAPGFVEKSMALMKARPEIEEVWPQLYNIHDAEPEVLSAGGIYYRLVTMFHLKGQDGPYGWHGFSTAFSLKRLSDYKKIGEYCKVPFVGNIWQREQAIGEQYRLKGYRTAVITDSKGNVQNFATNIGYGKSEYKFGTENDGRKDK
jgi:GT2 family glycosyltransferase